MRVRLDFYLHSTAPQRKGMILWYCNILHNQMTIDDLQRCLWKRQCPLSLQEVVNSFSIKEQMPVERTQLGNSHYTAKYLKFALLKALIKQTPTECYQYKTSLYFGSKCPRFLLINIESQLLSIKRSTENITI